MPYENPYGTRDARSARRSTRGPRQSEEQETKSLAGFELLADPATIASGAAISDRPDPEERLAVDSEIERLQANLERRTREVEALRAGLASHQAITSVEIAPDATHRGERTPLDIHSATQLAQDARRRERESREALESARAALTTPCPPRDPGSAVPEPTTSDDSTARWTTRALVSQELPTPSELEEAVRTETIVADTGQTDTRGASDPLALAESREETDRLRERIASNELELQAREAERGVLRQTLQDRERELVVRAEQLVEARERFDAQSEMLESTRAQLTHERSQNTAMQQLLQRLRQTLGSELEPSRQVDDAPPRIVLPTQETASSFDEFVRQGTPTPAPVKTAPLSRSPRAPALPAIFDAWLDDQIRRHFGPLGIDSLVDLLQAPIARRVRIDGPDIQLVLLGRGAWRAAGELASGLVRAGTPAFLIHVSDPDDPHAEGARSLAKESPLHALMRPLPAPQTPAELDRMLASVAADVVVSRHFLSRLEEPDAWLDALHPSRERGCALVFAERTGVEATPLPSAMTEIGDRIWQLMPERYKSLGDSGETIESWTEIFARGDAPAANGCLASMRRHFEFDLFARFGYLAEPFVDSEVGGNFSPDAPRDRRFLAQIAELDDRKIEAGVAPALYLVALVEPATGEDGDS